MSHIPEKLSLISENKFKKNVFCKISDYSEEKNAFIGMPLTFLDILHLNVYHHYMVSAFFLISAYSDSKPPIFHIMWDKNNVN